MNKLDFKKLTEERVIILDGAFGTELQKRGYLKDVGAPEELNILAPQKVMEIHKDYLEAGARIITANTFGANRLKLSDYNLSDKINQLNQEGIKVAKAAAKEYGALVSADVGPLGTYLTPLGTISFDEAYQLFSEQIKALILAEPDIIVIETMAEIREVKAAILAAKDNFSGPIIIQMTFTSDGTTVTGTDVLTFLSVVERLGVDAIGMNCSCGAKELAPLIKILSKNTNLPISFKPNAGMPALVNRETIFPGTVEEFISASEIAYNYGATLIGGCCGTNPSYIKALVRQFKNKIPIKRNVKEHFLVSSRTKTINLLDLKAPIIIGERINPTNRKKFQDDLKNDNFAVLRREAQSQVKSGSDILDVNMGLPGADEPRLMAKAVEEIQEVVSSPLCLDSSLPSALESGLKACAGKPIINSVNGEKEKLSIILPLAQRFGAAIIGLTIDENGIPKTADERLKIAERILSEAKKYGIGESEIILDFLTLSVSAMPEQINETLHAIKKSKELFPNIKTILGLSNVSFGLPNRNILNSTFLKLALESGLDMAILNPYEDRNIDDKYARNLLTGKDHSAEQYIKQHISIPKKSLEQINAATSPDLKLYSLILEGSKEEIASTIKEVLAINKSPLEIANDIILKALVEVGAKFNNKEYFLPQVIRSAEAAQIAFAQIKPFLNKNNSFKSSKIILATVKGDVHDIGKNIVSAVLESHGWDIIDLGKNVESQKILETAKKENVPIIGLSALMTTTMLEMEKIVQERNAINLNVKILIGGAPVTEKYAKEIGADGYAKDAVEAAKVAKALL